MKKPTLHMIGLHHTICNDDFAHCAFTGKVRRFPAMMKPLGYKVVEYSNGVSMSGSDEHVMILSEKELFDLLPHKEISMMGPNSIAFGPNWKEFDKRLKAEMLKRVQPGDIVCHPFGPVHQDIPQMFPEAYHVESGIGYHAMDFCPFRVYESYAVMHYQQGRNMNTEGLHGRHGSDYEWVVPNYYNIDDWEPKYEPGSYLLYFGRITEDKGLCIVRDIAKSQGIPVLVVGIGDATPFKTDNMKILPPVTEAKDKSEMLRNALAILMPTRYVEPFGGSGVEAQLCGTPVISSDFGCFAETVEHGKTGFRCHTLGDYLAAISAAGSLDRRYIVDRARSLYGLDPVGKMYDAVFMQIADLGEDGWYTKKSHYIKADRNSWERWWWGSCANTHHEEEKQLQYAEKMGLIVDRRIKDLEVIIPGKSSARVLDIGGGPVSLMLKCPTISKGKVVDPIEYPKWTVERYAARGIDVHVIGGEYIDPTEWWDEVWIYNCLQHSTNPERIIKNAMAVTSTLRIFEWIETGISEGHYHNLTKEKLEKWIGQKGKVEDFKGILHGRAFYGVFETSPKATKTRSKRNQAT